MQEFRTKLLIRATDVNARYRDDNVNGLRSLTRTVQRVGTSNGSASQLCAWARQYANTAVAVNCTVAQAGGTDADYTSYVSCMADDAMCPTRIQFLITLACQDGSATCCIAVTRTQGRDRVSYVTDYVDSAQAMNPEWLLQHGRTFHEIADGGEINRRVDGNDYLNDLVRFVLIVLVNSCVFGEHAPLPFEGAKAHAFALHALAQKIAHALTVLRGGDGFAFLAANDHVMNGGKRCDMYAEPKSSINATARDLRAAVCALLYNRYKFTNCTSEKLSEFKPTAPPVAAPVDPAELYQRALAAFVQLRGCTDAASMHVTAMYRALADATAAPAYGDAIAVFRDMRHITRDVNSALRAITAVMPDAGTPAGAAGATGSVNANATTSAPAVDATPIE